jgi:hypothetical protein
MEQDPAEGSRPLPRTGKKHAQLEAGGQADGETSARTPIPDVLRRRGRGGKYKTNGGATKTPLYVEMVQLVRPVMHHRRLSGP